MSDDYCQWSTEITLLTYEEKEWLTTIIEHTGWCPECDQIYSWPNMTVNEDACPNCPVKLEPPITDTGHDWPGFEYELRNSTLWMGSSENQAMDPAADLIEKFFAEFRPKAVHVITCSFTCSKPVVGGFSGSGVVIAAWGQEWKVLDDLEDEEELLMSKKPTLEIMEDSIS